MKMTPQRNKVINIAAAISIVLFSAIPTYASADHLDFHYLETSYLDSSSVEFMTPDFDQGYLNDEIKENLILE
ncbi:exported hypothetical protein [Vibrio coralliirubri]|uniref:hypothetical protein n=1 Tax=Vibrio coralliirubri TaxID=1516159 RepID=UPI00062EBB3D|nr:hypothetical protein [Vibrio coralliirubri]CDT65136.1 exported hypothetical protein [Vibrio coralliirubri]